MVHFVNSKEYLSFIGYDHLQKDNTANSASISKIKGVIQEFYRLLDIGTDVDQASLKEKLGNIAKLQPGLELLERLNKVKHRMKITAGEESQFFPGLELLKVNFDSRYFYVSLNQQGEKILAEAPNYIVLAHELIHALHAFEDSQAEKERENNNLHLTDPEMENEVEQLAICGIVKIDSTSNLQHFARISNSFGQFASFALSDRCCENSFLAALGLPLRINHNGPLSSPPDMTDLFRVGAIGSLREKVLSDPSQVNSIGHMKDAGGVSISALSAAAYYKQQEMLDLLIDRGADVNMQDEIGGPVLAAIKHDHIEFAQSLVDRQFNIALTDKHGKTALQFLNDTPRWRFCSRHKPLINKLTNLSQKQTH